MKVAFVCNEKRKLGTYPYVVNTARMLADAGIKVDIYVNQLQYENLGYDDIKILPVTPERDAKAHILNCYKAIKNSPEKYDYLAAFSFEGLVITLLLNLSGIKIKGIYFSLELIYSQLKERLKEELWGLLRRPGLLNLQYALINVMYLLFNTKLEKYVAFSVIMDKNRERLLRAEFSFVDKVFILPNSYIGTNYHYREDVIRKRYNISAQSKTLLYSGSVAFWAFDIELPEILYKLPEYVLIINGVAETEFAQTVKERYKDLIDSNRLIFNLEPLDEDEYSELVAFCDIGLPWYSPPRYDTNSIFLGDNVYYIGWSSGKLCKYLSCGLPVIAPDYYYNFSGMIDDNGIGYTCSKANEIVEKVKLIEKNYEQLKNNVRTYYQKELEFTVSFPKILQELTTHN